MIRVLANSDTYLSILTSPAHILAELTVEFVTGIIVYPIGRRIFRRWLVRHDQTAHHVNEGTNQP